MMTLGDHVQMELRSQDDHTLLVGKFRGAIYDLGELQKVLESLPSYAHVGSFGVGVAYNEKVRAEVNIYLSSKHKDSPLARELAQALGVNGVKSPGWAGDNLNVEYSWKDISVTVRNYLPQTCRVEEVEVDVPAHKERVRRVICSNGEEG